MSNVRLLSCDGPGCKVSVETEARYVRGWFHSFDITYLAEGENTKTLLPNQRSYDFCSRNCMYQFLKLMAEHQLSLL